MTVNFDNVTTKIFKLTHFLHIDPNIEEVMSFSITKSKKSLMYSAKQLISHEIELEKLRRMETHKLRSGVGAMVEQRKECVNPVHMQKLKPKSIKKPENVNSLYISLMIYITLFSKLYINVTIITITL